MPMLLLLLLTLACLPIRWPQPLAWMNPLTGLVLDTWGQCSPGHPARFLHLPTGPASVLGAVSRAGGASSFSA